MTEVKTQGGATVDVAPDVAQDAILRGQASATGTVQLVRGMEAGEVDAADVGTALAQGWELATPEQQRAAKVRSEEHGIVGDVRGTAEAFARGATFGLSDAALRGLGVDAERMAVRRQQVQGAGTLAEIGGGLVTGGGIAKGTGKLGAALLGESTGARLITSTAHGTIEGALQGAGSVVSQAALGDTDLTAEQLLAGAKQGATLGGLLGGGTMGLGLGLEHAYTGARRLGAGAIEKTLGGAEKVAGGGDNVLGALSKRQVELLGGGPEHVLAARRALERTRTPAGRELAELAASGGRGIDDAVGARLKSTLGKAGAGDAVRSWGSKIKASEGGRKLLAQRAGQTAEALAEVKGPHGAKLRKLLRAESRGIDNIEAYHKGRSRVQRVLDTMRDEGDEGLTRAQALAKDYLDAGSDTAIWGTSAKARDAVVAGQRAEREVLDALPPKIRKALTGGEIDDTTARALASKHLPEVEKVLSARTSVADALEGVGEDVSQLRRSLDDVKDSIGFRDRVAEVKADLDLLDGLEGGAGATARQVLETGGEVVGALAGGLSFGGGVLGKFAGKIAGGATRPASAIRVVARVRGGLDAIRARQGAAVAAFERLIDGGAKGARAAGRGATAVARRATPAAARKAQAERRTKLVQTITRVAQLASDPGKVQQQLDVPELHALAHGAPDVAGALAAGAARAVAYLATVAPPIHRPLYSPGVEMVDPHELELFERRLFAVQDPDGAIALLGQGAMTKEHAEALAAVYPKRWEELRRDVTEQIGARLADGKPVSFEARMQLGALGLTVTDPTLRPDTYAAIQASMGPASQPQQGAMQQPAPKKLDVQPPPMTQMQRLEAGAR